MRRLLSKEDVENIAENIAGGAAGGRVYIHKINLIPGGDIPYFTIYIFTEKSTEFTIEEFFQRYNGYEVPFIKSTDNWYDVPKFKGEIIYSAGNYSFKDETQSPPIAIGEISTPKII